jgi:hypothetical protein
MLAVCAKISFSNADLFFICEKKFVNKNLFNIIFLRGNKSESNTFYYYFVP